MAADGSPSHEKAGFFCRGWWWLKALLGKLISKVIEVARKTKKLGQDDPRRVYHSVKVGLALTLISLFYYYQPLYNSFGVSAMWAVMTVVVVFEFSVGATLGKGLNRGLATLLAGALGLGANHLASLSGDIGQPIVLGFLVFLQAAASTFIRFFPSIKARYDYGLLIFILTFSMVSVSGFHNDEILDIARKRLSTILIGCSACVIISIFICPVWAGEDLHKLVALNMEKLGYFLEEFGDEYFNTSEDGKSGSDNSFLQGYISVLNSKSSEESLANFARWEPCHGRFRFRHPWKQYLKIGTLIRQCAYRIEALNGYFKSNFQAPPRIPNKIQEACASLSYESGKALKELASAVKTMTQPSSADPHVANSKTASKNLKSLLKSDWWGDIDLLEVVPIATIALLLVDIVTCTDKIAESVHELASLADFQPFVSLEKSKSDQHENARSTTSFSVNCDHVVILVNHESSSAIPQKENGDPQ